MTLVSDTARGRRAGTGRLLARYQPTPGVYDELVDAGGVMRSHWAPVIGALAEMGPAEQARRFALADRHLAESGVFYRVYDDPAGAERGWPLSHLPLVIPDGEWQALSEGLVQRARLLDAILSDLYGPARLVQEGAIPAALVAGNPEFLRPLSGVVPPGGHHLHLYAADLGRGPDGRWWVIGDRAQAPSGAGYAVENRLAMTRALPDLFRSLNVERLAAFFQAFRAALVEGASREDPRIGLLTPGPLAETYFEHAYLARYLGFLLLEGGDLTVNDNVLYVRTISGLKRIDVLLRRLDADWCDPLELNAASQLGVPGLVQALRAGSFTMANGLGSGLVEARALMAFLPVLARRLLGQDLAIPNVATWWCGAPEARQHVLDRFDELAFAPAFPGMTAGSLGAAEVLAEDLDPEARAALRADLDRRGLDIVAQEPVTLSTMPVFEDGRLVARPFMLRCYVARGPHGWVTMPGGFCRISDREDARAVTMRAGTRSADVWVLSDRPVKPATMLPAAGSVPIRRTTGSLPSRAADNLFWLGRYLERVEQTLRVVLALGAREAEPDTTAGGAAARRRLAELLFVWGGAGLGGDAKAAAVVAAQALHARAWPASVPNLALAVRRTASVIRDRLAPDAWRAVEDLTTLLTRTDPQAAGEMDVVDGAQAGLRTIAAIAGLIEENMNRASGWRFIKLGRRIERGLATCRFTRHFADANAPSECLEVVLELCDSLITYRARYVMGAARLPILDLVVLDPANPRSVAYQASSLVHHLEKLPDGRSDGLLDAAPRLATRLYADLSTLEAHQIDRARLLGFEQVLMQVSDEITAQYVTQTGPVERRRGSYA
jgi:uncharacterized circularly permuted ATP-grasp superfamily protein/uncharacterized alpha-E superfamily protein